MTATREDVSRWIETAKNEGARYIISVCDTFDYDDYPVYCDSLIKLKEELPRYDGENMQRVNEIIEIDHDGTVTENLRVSKFI